VSGNGNEPFHATSVRIREALDQRLAAAANVLLPDVTDAEHQPASVNLTRLIEQCTRSRLPEVHWLVLTAVRGGFPTTDDLRAFMRYSELEPRCAEHWVLESVVAEPCRGSLELPMEIVKGSVLADVDFCARNETHTGIHRVVRETMRRWYGVQSLIGAAWTEHYTALRSLTPAESDRVFSYSGTDTGLGSTTTSQRDDPDTATLLIPWQSVLLLPDVPNAQASSQLAALARYSGNTVSMIGYDLIPVLSAEQRPPVDATVTALHLSAVKHFHRLAAISRSSAAEFGGFARTLTAQGLKGPTITTVPLTLDAPPNHREPRLRVNARPIVLCPGTREPHKNQRTVLHAAERLWREGLDFELRLVGGRGWSDAVLQPAIERLKAAGRPLVDVGRVAEDQLWEEFRSADLTVFISLHEGYGLPVAESLAVGTPVLTSDFGSLREIADGGGCHMVDPRDDASVADGLRGLLKDPAALERLRDEARRRPRRTWDDYARDLWDAMVPSQAEVGQQ
jgi:glycosyltransferase involved in cell wall biosynthesis